MAKSATAELDGRGHLRVTGMAQGVLTIAATEYLFLGSFSVLGAVMTRRRAGNPQADVRFSARGADQQAGRWSAGRRSARSAGFANPLDVWRRASRTGVATPFVRRAIPEPRKLRQGVSQAPGASRRSILVQNGNRERAAPRPLNSRGGGALANPLAISSA